MLLLVQVVDKVAAGSVRAESGAVIRAAEVRLVLWVPGDGPELGEAMSKLALVSVLARSVLLVGPAQLRLVATRVDGDGGRGGVQLAGLAGAAAGGSGRRRRRRGHV